MKSKEFITEDKFNLLQTLQDMGVPSNGASELASTVNQIKSQCRPFLNEIEDPFSLLRGLRPVMEWAIKKSVRLDDRKPLSTPRWLHDELNTIFTKNFGAPFRNAMFCTGYMEQATVYGMPFAIFPIGEYKYLWNPKYRDLYQKFDEYRFGNRGNDPKQFVTTIDFSTYKTNGLNDAVNINNGIEIMLRCKSYYGLNMYEIHKSRNTGPIMNTIQDFLNA